MPGSRGNTRTIRGSGHRKTKIRRAETARPACETHALPNPWVATHRLRLVMEKAIGWIKAHYDRVALLAAAVLLFISSVSIWWSVIQFGNRLALQPAPPPKPASPPGTAVELDQAARELQHPAQWKSTGRSGLFVPEKHFIGANGVPAT